MRTTSFGSHRRRPKFVGAGRNFFCLKEDLLISSFPANRLYAVAAANATQRKALRALVSLLARQLAHEVAQGGASRDVDPLHANFGNEALGTGRRGT